MVAISLGDECFFFRNFLSFINWLTNPCITATLSHCPHKLNNQLALSFSLSPLLLLTFSVICASMLPNSHFIACFSFIHFILYILHQLPCFTDTPTHETYSSQRWCCGSNNNNAVVTYTSISSKFNCNVMETMKVCFTAYHFASSILPDVLIRQSLMYLRTDYHNWKYVYSFLFITVMVFKSAVFQMEDW